VEVANLATDLVDADIREIFAELEDQLKRSTVNADGSALLVFGKRSEAKACVADFDKAKVDGKPMFLRLLQLHDDSDAAPSSRFTVQKSKRAMEPPARRDQERFSRPERPRHESKSSLFGGGLMELEEEEPRRRGNQGGNRNRGGYSRSTQGRGGGRGGGRGRDREPAKSVEEMDAELLAYRKKKSATNQA
jgi:RNA recognition motif-containing protein